jgi:hypothetical protein
MSKKPLQNASGIQEVLIKCIGNARSPYFKEDAGCFSKKKLKSPVKRGIAVQEVLITQKVPQNPQKTPKMPYQNSRNPYYIEEDYLR